MDNNLAERNITFDLMEQALKNPQRIALMHEGVSYNYKELNELVWNVSANLVQKGVKSGDTIALSCESELLYALVIMANARLGVTTLCIPRSAPPIQIKDACKQARCAKILTDWNMPFNTGLPIISIESNDILGGVKASQHILIESPSQPLMLAVGSGSTGRKKLMPLNHLHMGYRCHFAMNDPVLYEDSRVLCLSSLGFISVVNRLFYAIRAGVTFVLLDKSAINIADFIEKNKVTALVVSVFHLYELLQKAEGTSKKHLKSLKAIRCVGSTLTEELKIRVYQNLNENLVNAYATNESGVISRTAIPITSGNKLGVGHVIPGVTVEIVDSKNIVMKNNEIGKIRIRTKGLIEGYLYDDEATEKAFKDGWFYPGDLGSINDNNELIFYGRADRMMIMNGINIYPAEIEQAMAAHPAIEDCVAFPLPHPVYQDVPICAVSLKENFTLTENKLLAYGQQTLGFSHPRRVIMLDRIPRTIEGKIEANTLRKLIAEVLYDKTPA